MKMEVCETPTAAQIKDHYRENARPPTQAPPTSKAPYPSADNVPASKGKKKEPPTTEDLIARLKRL